MPRASKRSGDSAENEFESATVRLPSWATWLLGVVIVALITGFSTWLTSVNAAVTTTAKDLSVASERIEANTKNVDRIESQVTDRLKRIEDKLDQVIREVKTAP